MEEKKCTCNQEIKCPNCKCTIKIEKPEVTTENQNESKKMNLND